MGEYNRLNKMLQDKQRAYVELGLKNNKTDEECDLMADLYQSIGEIKGTLLDTDVSFLS